MKQPFCLLSFDYPPLEGGISRLCCAIVEELKTQGNQISAVSRQAAPEMSAFDAPDVEEFRVSRKRGHAEWQLFWHLLRKKRKHTVIAGVWYPEGFIAALAGCKNLVLLVHGNEVMEGKPSFKNKVLSALRRWTIKRSKLVISNSDYTARLVKSQCPDANVLTIPLGVDEQRFLPKTSEQRVTIRKKLNLHSEKKLVLTTSRVQEYKGHDVVLDALTKLPRDAQENLQYLVAGRGEHLTNLQNRAKELGLDNMVSWLGFVDEKDLPDLYASVDLFVLCTREEKFQKQVEGFGLVFLEAQSCAVPAVGTRQGGIPNAVIPQKGGWLIERDDHQALADILVTLHNAPELIELQGTRARERILEEATWTIYGRKVLACLNDNF